MGKPLSTRFRSHSAAPMGFSLRGFHPIRKASGPLGPSYPACRFIKRPLDCFCREISRPKNSLCRANAPLRPSAIVDGQSRTLKPRLPGLILPDDQRYAPAESLSFAQHSAALGFVALVELKHRLSSLSLAPIGVLTQPGAQPI